MYTIKTVYRWLLWQFISITRQNVKLGMYGPQDVTHGYRGWWEYRGRVIAFLRDDETNQFRW